MQFSQKLTKSLHPTAGDHTSAFISAYPNLSACFWSMVIRVLLHLHCYPGLLKVETCFIEIDTRKSQFNLKAFTFTTFVCSLTTCA
jgi:hypothetical protein